VSTVESTAVVVPDVAYQVENPANLEAAVALWQKILPIMGERIGEYNYKLGFRLDPDWESIAISLVQRTMILCTAKRGDDLLGYQIWVLNPYIWQRGKVSAISLATNGGWKRGVDARRLANVGINYLKSIGVHALIVSAPFDSAAEKMWTDLGLEKLEALMGKNICAP
jgi:hypothetical protein